MNKKITNINRDTIYIKSFILVLSLSAYACSGKTTKQDFVTIPDSVQTEPDIKKDSILLDTIDDSDVFSKITLPKSHKIIQGVNKKLSQYMREKPSTRKDSRLSLKTPDEIAKILGKPSIVSIKSYQITDTIADLNLRTLLSNIKNPILMEVDHGKYNEYGYKIYYLREKGVFKSFYGKDISPYSDNGVQIEKYILVDQDDINPKENDKNK